MGQSPEETKHRLLKSSLPVESQKKHIKFFQQWLWRHTWNVVHQESSVETQCSRVLLGAGHIGPSQNPRVPEESKCSARANCFPGLGVVSRCYHLGQVSISLGTVYHSHSTSQCYKAGLSKNACQAATLTLFCTGLKILYKYSYIRKMLRELERCLPGLAVSHKIRVQISYGAL